MGRNGSLPDEDQGDVISVHVLVIAEKYVEPERASAGISANCLTTVHALI